MDITKGQRKILVTASITVVLFAIFWIFVYIPAKNSVKVLKVELLQVENKINDFEAIIGKDKSLEEGFFMMQNHLEELDSKFPANEKETLRMISSTAYEFGIDVISIKSQPKSDFLDKDKNVIKIEDRLCQKMTIFMAVRSRHMELVAFLEALREDIPHILTIEKIKIIKEPVQNKLKADIDLTMYLLVKEK